MNVGGGLGLSSGFSTTIAELTGKLVSSTTTSPSSKLLPALEIETLEIETLEEATLTAMVGRLGCGPLGAWDVGFTSLDVASTSWDVASTSWDVGSTSWDVGSTSWDVGSTCTSSRLEGDNDMGRPPRHFPSPRDRGLLKPTWRFTGAVGAVAVAVAVNVDIGLG